MKILGNRVLVEITQLQRQFATRGGIIIPDKFRVKPCEGIILNIGAGDPAKKSAFALMAEVAVGNTVRLDTSSGSVEISKVVTETEYRETRLYSILDIIGVVEEVAEPVNA